MLGHADVYYAEHPGGHAVGLFKNTTVSFDQLLAHMVYAQEVLGYTALDVAYWTLCLEVQFYRVFTASAVAVRAWPGSRP